MNSRTCVVYVVTTATFGLACGGFAAPGPAVVVPAQTTNPPPPQEKILGHIFQNADGTCMSESNFDCPPQAKCNPPPPTPVACPPVEETGVLNRAGTCVALTAFKCPPKMDCASPNEKEVPCQTVPLVKSNRLWYSHQVGVYI